MSTTPLTSRRELEQERERVGRVADVVQRTMRGNTPNIVRRAMLELLVAFKLQERAGLSLEVALDTLSLQLDVPILLHSENEDIQTKLEATLRQLDIPHADTPRLLNIVDFFTSLKEERAKGIYSFPTWLLTTFEKLLDVKEPIMFLSTGRSTLVPRLLHRMHSESAETPDFVTFDEDSESIEGLRLILALVLEDLEQIRRSVLSYEELKSWVEEPMQQQLGLFGENITPPSTEPVQPVLWQFGSIVADLTTTPRKKERGIVSNLPLILSQALSVGGRAFLMAPPALLDLPSWQRLREQLQQALQLEAVADFSLSSEPLLPGATTFTLPALAILKRQQHDLTHQTTLMWSEDGDEGSFKHNLRKFVDTLVGNEPINDIHLGEALFERPTLEIQERWDPKFYSPARQSLQDTLISSPQGSWLEGVTTLIAAGSVRSRGKNWLTEGLKPFLTASVSQRKLLGEQQPVARVKAGDQVWLQYVSDVLSHAPEIRVERRSGTLIGFLSDEATAEIGEALALLNSKHPATVVEARIENETLVGITIRFAPPQYAGQGEAVTLLRPRDIRNNRLLGAGEVVWLLHEYAGKAQRLQRSDILLALQGLGKACIVPGEFEGAICVDELIILRPETEIDSLYLLSFMLSSEFQEQLRYISRGGVRIAPYIRVDDLKELLVIVPPLEDQRRIALAFAESQGDLGPSLRETAPHWRRIARLSDAVEEKWITSSLLANLFSDWEQIQTLSDWSRLKDTYIEELFDLVTGDSGSLQYLNNVLEHLGFVNRIIKALPESPPIRQTSQYLFGQGISDLKQSIEEIPDPLLKSRFFRLLQKVKGLLEAERVLVPVSLVFENPIIPEATPTTFHLRISNISHSPLSDLRVTLKIFEPDLHAEPQTWTVGSLAAGESQTMTGTIRFDAGSADIYTQYGLAFHMSAVWDKGKENEASANFDLTVDIEVIPIHQLSFEPIRPNPYITGGAVNAPEMFFGREDVLHFLKDNLIGTHQNNVIILQGNRRTGKTSVLKQVVNRNLFEQHLPVYIDCQGLGKLHTQDFFYKIARAIQRAAKHRLVTTLPEIKRSDISETDAFYDFREYLDGLTLALEGRKLILLIDEFEIIDQSIRAGGLDSSVLPNLRHLFQHRNDIAVVLTGSYQLTRLREDYWSILFGIGLKKKIDLLDESAARALVVQPLQGKVEFDERAVNYIMDLTASHPYFIQMLCHDLVNVLNSRRMAFVPQNLVDEAVQQTLISADGHLKYMFDTVGTAIGHAILVHMANLLAPQEGMELGEIEGFVEENRLPVSRAEVEAELREMRERDLLMIEMDRTGTEKYYAFKIDLLRQWIRHNHDLRWTIKQAQDSKIIRER